MTSRRQTVQSQHQPTSTCATPGSARCVLWTREFGHHACAATRPVLQEEPAAQRGAALAHAG